MKYRRLGSLLYSSSSRGPSPHRRRATVATARGRSPSSAATTQPQAATRSPGSAEREATWDEAYVVPKCDSPGPWDLAACLLWANPIPGTEWIAVSADKSGPATSWYRRKIRLPKRCRSATLEIDVHADNDVTLYLNGAEFGAQPAGPLPPNFQGPPEHFTTNDPFRRRWNALESWSGTTATRPPWTTRRP
jgi:hypothetical protein